jgi:hypothetical protein
MERANFVENYEKACIDRKKDFSIMRRSNRKVMTIYLGGIYLECLLKSVIINKYKIVIAICVRERNRRRIYWYSESSYNKLQSILKPTRKDYINLHDGFNPEHNLVFALRQIEELNRTLPVEGVRKLEMLNRPIDNRSFTNIRYMYDDEIPEKLYNEWESNFLYFMNFFNRMKKTFKF